MEEYDIRAHFHLACMNFAVGQTAIFINVTLASFVLVQINDQSYKSCDFRGARPTAFRCLTTPYPGDEQYGSNGEGMRG